MQAQGVSTTAQAIAEFDTAIQSDARASTQEDAVLCAGYWLGLKEVHNASEGVAFWEDMPTRLNAETAELGYQYWIGVLRDTHSGDEATLQAVGSRVVAYRQQMITRVVEAESTGSIQGVFNILGMCTPR